MDPLIELAGVWLARAYAVYGAFFLIIPALLFVDLLLLGAVVWAEVSHARERRWARLAVEIKFGLINPALYLAILAPSLPELQSGLTPLTATAWILLTAFWTLRLFGAALDMRSSGVRVAVRTLLAAALVCVLLYTVKDAWLLARTDMSAASPFTAALNVLRLGPLYLIPAVLLWGYVRSISRGLFLLPNRAARLAVAGVAGVAVVTFALAAHRRSDATVRKLVSEHRESIHAAAARYDVDPRLIASIVYVIHRDQLSPFRGALERLVITVWARNLRREFGMRPPDGTGEGADENPLLNRALDISVGLAQIKPRTAQTASVLATGRKPNDLPKPMFFSYLDVEPIGDRWLLQAAARTPVSPPIPVPAEKYIVANALLNARSNLDTCALILAIYQRQWESANRDWSLRARPGILATLYQIGFARSQPHGAPRSNVFGSRVQEVYE
ncbi:MAG: hypothetical protein ACKV2U_34335 [Bryobacteraceae bacterium]